MRRLPLALGAGSLLLVFTSTVFPADRAARDALLWEAAKECERTVKDIFVKDIDQFGRVWFEYGRAGPFAQEQFTKCFQDRVRAKTQAAPLVAAGRLSLPAGAPPETSVPIEVVERIILVQAAVNGFPPTLFILLDTGAQFTLLNPVLAKRWRVAVPPNAPRVELAVVGGKTVSVPLARVRVLKVGELAVEDMDVGVFDAFPDVPGVGGLLGGDFLQHFSITLDRAARRLTLMVPQQPGAGPPASAQPAAPPAPPREPAKAGSISATMPTWQPGYEWKFHWADPSGSGTYVRSIVGEELLAGVPHYVMRSGTRDILYTKADLAWGLERVRDGVETRASPAYRGFAWPLEPGKEWEARYRWESISERRTEDRVRRHKVEAQETVSVPAGTFQALHVIVKDPTGRWVYEYWYAPEAKWIVKDRTYLPSGVRERELLEYRLRPTPIPSSQPAR